MPRITVLPHPDCVPSGASIEATPGTSICDALLENDIDIEHACGKVGACTTCHVIVREDFHLSRKPATMRKTCLTGLGAWSTCPVCRARRLSRRRILRSRFHGIR